MSRPLDTNTLNHIIEMVEARSTNRDSGMIDGHILLRDLKCMLPPDGEVDHLTRALRHLSRAADFLQLCERENPDPATGVWRDAYDWVEKASLDVVKAFRGETSDWV